MAGTRFWEEMTPVQIARFQMFEPKMCVPFSVFHEALEKALGRPVWTHELALNHDGLKRELMGEEDAPTMEDIINLIPEEKRIVVDLVTDIEGA